MLGPKIVLISIPTILTLGPLNLNRGFCIQKLQRQPLKTFRAAAIRKTISIKGLPPLIHWALYTPRQMLNHIPAYRSEQRMWTYTTVTWVARESRKAESWQVGGGGASADEQCVH